MTTQPTTISPGDYFRKTEPKPEVQIQSAEAQSELKPNPQTEPQPQPESNPSPAPTPAPVTPPLTGFWKLLGQAWKDFEKSGGQFAILDGLTVLSGFLVFLSIFAFNKLSTAGDELKSGIGALLVIAAVAIAVFAFIRLWSAKIILACRTASEREKISLKRIFVLGRVNSRFIIGSTVLSLLVSIITLPLLLIPGFIATSWFQFSPFAAAAEDLGGIKTLGRSQCLAQKYIWENLILTSALFILIIVLFNIFILFLALDRALSVAAGEILAGVIMAVLTWAMVILTCPVFLFLFARRYFELAKMEKEGGQTVHSRGAVKAVILILITLSLGIYGAYAYSQIGKPKMINEPQPAKIEPIQNETNNDEINNIEGIEEIPQSELDEIPME